METALKLVINFSINTIKLKRIHASITLPNQKTIQFVELLNFIKLMMYTVTKWDSNYNNKNHQ